MTNERGSGVAGATSREFATGQRVFGRYTLIKILGRGGMGIVWLARDEELEHDVALKFLPDLMIQDHSVFDQLKRETRRCLELTHPHIVRIHDFIHDERCGCISMEYIDGETLSNLRAEKERKVFEPEEIATWTRQLCDALDYAHNHAKVVHCDLKPANLMVNQRGELKVSDFGIARSLVDSASRLTVEQGRSGTLVYMSPQQLDGDRCRQLDDIYSLGASIYELLTSKPPFYSGNIDRQIHERVAPSMTERRKELDIEPAQVPQVWEDAVAACLAKDPSQRPQSTAEVAERLQLGPAEPGTRRAAPKKSNRKVVLVGCIAALFVLGLAGLYLGAFNQQAKPVSQAAAIPEKSIAVLPFENLSANQENAFFADGVQDAILTDLAKVADLKVISRTSVMQYKTGVKRNVREIANALGVAHVVEGSVQREGNRVRVSAQLIDARSDSELWAERYDREVADVFAIQSELAGKIVAQLQAKISPSEKAAIEEAPTSDVEAFNLYAHAKTLIDSALLRESSNDLFEGVRLLDKAVERDSSFFLAYYQLARAHDAIYQAGLDHTPARLALADSAIQSLRRFRPDAGETHLAVARHLYWGYLDYDRARPELITAQKALPNNADAFLLAAYIDRRQGRWDESTRNFERASQLDPRDIEILQQLSLTYENLRRYADAATALDRTLTIAPNDIFLRTQRARIPLRWQADTKPLYSTIQTILTENPNAASVVAGEWLLLALYEGDSDAAERALAAMPSGGCNDASIPFPNAWCEGLADRMRGDQQAAHAAFAKAHTELEKMLRDQPDYAEALCALGVVDAALGNKEDAIREGRRAVELMPVSKNAIEGPLLIKYLAAIYAWTGEKESAFRQLDKAVHLPCYLSYGELRLHPIWDPLRDDPRFERIVASLAPK